MRISSSAFSTRFKRACGGASLLEYSLLVGLIAVVSIGSVVGLSTEVSSTFSSTTAALSTNMVQGNMPQGPSGPTIDGLDRNDLGFDFVAGGDANANGYSNQDGYGALTVTHAGNTSVKALKRQFTYNTTTFFYLEGNVSDLTQHVLTCNGVPIPTSTASTQGSYSASLDQTEIMWRNGTGHDFTPGQSYSCIFKD